MNRAFRHSSNVSQMPKRLRLLIGAHLPACSLLLNDSPTRSSRTIDPSTTRVSGTTCPCLQTAGAISSEQIHQARQTPTLPRREETTRASTIIIDTFCRECQRRSRCLFVREAPEDNSTALSNPRGDNQSAGRCVRHRQDYLPIYALCPPCSGLSNQRHPR